MTGNHADKNLGDEAGLSRRDLIQRIVVGSAFALPIVASFDMASMGVSTASANAPNQTDSGLVFASADGATFTVGEALTFAVWVTGPPAITVSQSGKLPKGVTFTAILDNYDIGNDTNATIAGTPAAGTGGVYPITMTADNGFDPQASQKFTVTVNQRPAFTSAAKATVHVGTKANVKLATSGHPHATITLTGKLPLGMHFTHDAAKGTASISGKPQKVGVHKLKLTASNGATPKATQEFLLTVAKYA